MAYTTPAGEQVAYGNPAEPGRQAHLHELKQHGRQQGAADTLAFLVECMRMSYQPCSRTAVCAHCRAAKSGLEAAGLFNTVMTQPSADQGSWLPVPLQCI